MRLKLFVLALAALVTAIVPVQVSASDITPAVQGELDRLKQSLGKWASDPVIVHAVKEQNAKGPIPGMDNAKWKTIRRSDPIVQGLIHNPAGEFLKKMVDASGGTLDKAFLCGVQGEKVAFAEKTISYLHKGQEKFDVPMATGKPWQMTKQWFDESLQAYALQVAVPVMDGGKPIGVLVASVPVSHLDKVAKK
jgi:hypothetical protein